MGRDSRSLSFASTDVIKIRVQARGKYSLICLCSAHKHKRRYADGASRVVRTQHVVTQTRPVSRVRRWPLHMFVRAVGRFREH